MEEVLDKLHEINEERTTYPISTNSLYHMFLKSTSKADLKDQIEFNFIFNLYELTFQLSEVPTFIRGICFNLMTGRLLNPETEIKVTEALKNRVSPLVD